MANTTSNTLRIARGTALAALTACAFVAPLSGCGEDPPPPVVQETAPPPPPPEPPAPSVTPIAQLMKELGISSKIRLPEDKAPATDPERVAVLKFFDGFAKSNAEAIKPVLSEEDALILDIMVKSGGFASATQPVERIDLITGSVGNNQYALAVFRHGEQYQAQLWEFDAKGEGKTVTSQEFSSYAQPMDVLSKIRGDLIPEWIKLVAAERRMADDPDEVIKPPQRVQKAEEEEETAATKGNGPITAPPMRRKPQEPIAPPDFRPGQ